MNIYERVLETVKSVVETDSAIRGVSIRLSFRERRDFLTYVRDLEIPIYNENNRESTKVGLYGIALEITCNTTLAEDLALKAQDVLGIGNNGVDSLIEEFDKLIDA